MNKKPKRNKIINWTINLKWDNGTYENISCMNNETSSFNLCDKLETNSLISSRSLLNWALPPTENPSTSPLKSNYFFNSFPCGVV